MGGLSVCSRVNGRLHREEDRREALARGLEGALRHLGRHLTQKLRHLKELVVVGGWVGGWVGWVGWL